MTAPTKERMDFLNPTRKMRFMVDLRRVETLAGWSPTTARSPPAADALHLTPSAVSQQLAALEREIGHTLLEPDGRTVRLTAAAHVLLSHADALFAQIERMQGEAAAQDPHAGAARCASADFPTSLAGLLAPAARPLRARAPDLRVRVPEAETDEADAARSPPATWT